MTHIHKAEYWHGLYIHYMYNTPLSVIAAVSVCVVLVLGISQDTTTSPLRGTEEGVYVIILVRIPAVLLVNVTVNPIAAYMSLSELSTTPAVNIPFRLVLHLTADPVTVHVQIL